MLDVSMKVDFSKNPIPFPHFFNAFGYAHRDYTYMSIKFMTSFLPAAAVRLWKRTLFHPAHRAKIIIFPKILISGLTF